jgi:hypothetical protein
MISKNFTTGGIEQVLFDPGSRYLEVHWRNKRIVAFRPVPEEITRRLCNAPNPSTYLEDRIAEEYSKVEPRKSQTTDDAKTKLDDLFGG